MITVKDRYSYNQKHYTGLSTDSKPTNCGANSLFTELNTGNTYMAIYDSKEVRA